MIRTWVTLLRKGYPVRTLDLQYSAICIQIRTYLIDVVTVHFAYEKDATMHAEIKIKYRSLGYETFIAENLFTT